MARKREQALWWWVRGRRLLRIKEWSSGGQIQVGGSWARGLALVTLR